jgi:hypothetical protein
MNVNDIFSSITNFWERISPLAYAHIVFFLGLRYIAGIRLQLRDTLTVWTKSASYRGAKHLLTEFELWKKLPFLLIAAALVYLTLLQDALSIPQRLGIPLLRVSYAEEQFWIEAKPINLIEKVLEFAPPSRRQYWQVRQLKEQLLDEYKAKAPDRYQRMVAWHEREFTKHLRALEIGVAFVISVIVVVVWYWRRQRAAGIRHAVSWWRVILLLFFAIGFCAYERVCAEQTAEFQLYSELLFVGDELQFDTSRASSRLPPTEFAAARRELVCQFLQIDEHRRLDLPWFSRTVERIRWHGKPLLKRQFAYTSKDQLRQNYGYLFHEPSSDQNCNDQMPTQGQDRDRGASNVLPASCVTLRNVTVIILI